MKIKKWLEEPKEQLSPTLSLQSEHVDNITICRVEQLTGTLTPVHQHPNQQITTILQGILRVTIGDETRDIHANESLFIPADVPHGTYVVEDVLALEVFSPIREDWLRGDDSYLRASVKQTSEPVADLADKTG